MTGRGGRAALRRALTGPRALVERLVSVPVVRRSGLFDPGWYAAQGGRRRLPVLDYVVRGRRAGLAPNPLFEPASYDPARWRRAGADPVWVYLREGRRRSPHPLLDARRLVGPPPALAHRGGPLGALLEHLPAESALPTPVVGAGRPHVTRARAAAAAAAADGRWRHQEELRRIPRTVAAIDPEADRRYVLRWSGASLPPTGPGRPLVSVVLPVRDRPGAVRDAIASVRAQTLADWELIVADDGSTDDTAAAAETAAGADGRIRVLRLPHAGVSAARNAAQQLARGSWIGWLDSDNTWVPHFLRTALAALAATDDRAGYASVELRTLDGVRYRALAGGRDLLAVQNHIDLNTLLVRADLLAEVGGFDTSLRRAVDYDLALRLGEHAGLRHLPFVGARYDERRDRADRLTVRELRSWTQVVRARRLVDWPALDAALADRVPGRTSVVVPVRDDWTRAHRCVDALLRHAGGDLEIVLVDAAGDRPTARLVAALEVADDRVSVVRWPTPATPGLVGCLGLAATTGDVVALAEPSVVVSAGWAAPLRAALADPAAAAAVPVVVGADGVVAAAGLAGSDRGWQPLFTGHPPEDPLRTGGYPVAAAPPALLAVRAEDLVALRGPDALLTTAAGATLDLCRRLVEHRGGDVRLTRSVVTDLADADGTRARPRPEPAVDAGLTAARWPHVPTPDLDLAAAAGLRPRGVPAVVTHGRPQLRWSIATAAPVGERGSRWGDTHFASSLAAALTALGQQVVTDRDGSRGRPTARLDDVVLTLRGLLPPPVPSPGTLSVLWVISHPELVGDAELRSVDLAFAASGPWAAAAARRAGREVLPLLQCTDPARFGPGPAPGDAVVPAEHLLFVGSSRGVYRPSVRVLREAGFDVAVWGRQWEPFLGPDGVRGDDIPNERLAGHYRRADLVLADHWPDMRSAGFASNRLFDAVASGARVVSDDVPGLEALFDGCVRTWSTPAELIALAAADASTPLFPSAAGRLPTAERVRREHSFAARAATLVDAVAAQLARR